MKAVHAGERAPCARELENGQLPQATRDGCHCGDEVPDPELRSRLTEALRAMLERVESERMETAELGDAGVAMILEHNQVRCVLVVRGDQSRHGLSPRELEVARLVADGFTNRTIGTTLGISSWTVSTHTRRIFVKLGVSCRAEMVARLFGVSFPPPGAAVRS